MIRQILKTCSTLEHDSRQHLEIIDSVSIIADLIHEDAQAMNSNSNLSTAIEVMIKPH